MRHQMKRVVEIRRVSGVPALFVAVAGIALSASGCGARSHTTPACTPDLAVRWRIVDSASTGPLSCDEVGATTIRVGISGDATDFPCPTGQSTGSIPFYLDAAGSYPVTITLLDGASVLAQGSTSAVVDCSGLSQTAVVPLAPVGSCSPDLTISWRIVSNIDGLPLTCGEAGNADTLTALIDGGVLGTTLTAFDTACPVSATQGSFVVLLPASGTYNVSLELTSGATLRSETPILVQAVDCSGLSATPRADLFVDF